MNSAIAQPGFDAVARQYDEQRNPMLALEERYLSGLMPSVRGSDVVELGCGTGRWLYRLRDQGAHTLSGVDTSESMLAVARKKLGGVARLLCSHLEKLPLAHDTADVILLPFVLSYCADLELVAREVARIARPGAVVFVSDVHPETEQRLNWRRTFAADDSTVTMPSVRHSIAEVIKQFERAGFDCAVNLELSFGAEEVPIFASAGKADGLKAIGDLPAIYTLQFVFPYHGAKAELRFAGAKVALGASAAVRADIEVASGTICRIDAQGTDASRDVDLGGMTILPGLINAHDHLEFALYPNLGRGRYRNATEWAADIQAREKTTIAQQELVPKDVRLYFGALRNLLSGVTTVCHHNPQAAVFCAPDFPVRVIGDVDWAHSLAFDREKVNSLGRTKRVFAVHVAEGTDEDASKEIAQLRQMGALNERAILVHALGCSAGDVAMINEAGAAVVVCPSSNQFLYGRTLSGERMREVKRVALGTDSPLTARGDLLDELRCARDAWQLSANELYAMCTSGSASVLDLHDGSGRVQVSGRADMLVVRDGEGSPAERLLALQTGEIELVVIAGRPHFASDAMYLALPEELKAGLAPLLVEGVRRWARAPLRWMFDEAEAVLDKPVVLGGKRVAYAG